MISTPLAQQLREAGLTWTPVSGDAFQVAGHEFEGDVFTVSDMTIEAHTFSTGTVLGFNGTTEWALDSVALDDVVWLPREDQLRDALGAAFVAMERVDGASGVEYDVTVTVDGDSVIFVSEDPAESYGMALLALLQSVR
ncbi:pilus assembly protein CpaE [Microbacterium sp. MPKO10]|uniref:pilus assembly protein CpaE n=1 Tax=Microbacterium sp. MPKO10 TaxID=2989818 RepID=UPI0022366FD9|nr:pilus assembly protein CpaE [Microbacterium sp. MPKO10]MCW4457265.1 pilus assembly protein CpaE [Microbacterium sp. MPKO10]